jgi:hypothetical protein
MMVTNQHVIIAKFIVTTIYVLCIKYFNSHIENYNLINHEILMNSEIINEKLNNPWMIIAHIITLFSLIELNFSPLGVYATSWLLCMVIL